MSKPLHVSYNWDTKKFLQGAKAAYDYELKNSRKRFLGWIFIALTQFGVVLALKQGTIGMLALSTILVLYWYGFRWKIREYFLIKSFENSPLKDKKFEVKLNDEGLFFNDSPIDFKDIYEIVSTDEGVLLYFIDNYIFVPSSAFENLEDKSEFLKRIKRKIKEE